MTPNRLARRKKLLLDWEDVGYEKGEFHRNRKKDVLE